MTDWSNVWKNAVKFEIWLVVDLPLWKMMDFVSWDDYEIPNMESHVIHSMVPVTTKPPTKYISIYIYYLGKL